MSSALEEHTRWQGVDGKPVVGGLVFFGTQGQDPTTGYPSAPVNLITVYTDRALTVVAANPQTTTSNGRTTNKIFVPEQYSIALWDSADVQKYINLDVGKSSQTGVSNLTNVSGTDTITADGDPTITTLSDEEIFTFIAVGTNTGAVTLQIDSTAAKSVLKSHDEPLVAGDIEANQAVSVIYNSTDDVFELVSNAINPDILFGELSDHASTPVAGKGIIWVRDDAPNSLMFTDDAGTDHVITGQFAIKASDESVTSSTTLQDDNDLSITLAANGVYEIELRLLITSASTTPDFKYQLVEADGTWQAIIQQVTTVAVSLFRLDDSSAATFLQVPTTTISTMYFNVHAIAGGSGGVFKLQWAQQVSDGTAMTLQAGSWIRARRLA